MENFLVSPPEGVIGTSTALIYSPDLQSVLFVEHERFQRLMPPGGKVETKRDSWLFLHALWNEMFEEAWVFRQDVVPIDMNGREQEDVILVIQPTYPLFGKKAMDTLYLFKLRTQTLSHIEGTWVPVELIIADTTASF